jgi:hypothetical protein
VTRTRPGDAEVQLFRSARLSLTMHVDTQRPQNATKRYQLGSISSRLLRSERGTRPRGSLVASTADIVQTHSSLWQNCDTGDSLDVWAMTLCSLRVALRLVAFTSRPAQRTSVGAASAALDIKMNNNSSRIAVAQMCSTEDSQANLRVCSRLTEVCCHLCFCCSRKLLGTS